MKASNIVLDFYLIFFTGTIIFIINLNIIFIINNANKLNILLLMII